MKRDKTELKISMMENELAKYDEVLSIKDAQEKINNMERKNMEQMGLFITLTTFLVGLLSIFIGNNGQVSIVEKMRYVIVLGLILLIFICVGYFMVREKDSKTKCWIFGVLSLISVLSILGICYMPDGNNVQNKETVPETIMPDKNIIEVNSESKRTVIKQECQNRSKGADKQDDLSTR